jgi:hypothetical protein
MEANDVEKVFQTHKQQWIKQWLCQLNVTKMTRATNRMLTTALAGISIVDGAHRRVHEPTWNRNVFGIKALWLGDLFNADPLDFIVGVEAEVDGLHLL